MSDEKKRKNEWVEEIYRISSLTSLIVNDEF